MTIVVSPDWRIIAFGRADWTLARRHAAGGKWVPKDSFNDLRSACEAALKRGLIAPGIPLDFVPLAKLIRTTADALGKLPATIAGRWRIEMAERHDTHKPNWKPTLVRPGFHLLNAANERQPRHVGVYDTVEDAISGAVHDIAASRPEKIDIADAAGRMLELATQMLQTEARS